jgi:hypothetical protein
VIVFSVGPPQISWVVAYPFLENVKAVILSISRWPSFSRYSGNRFRIRDRSVQDAHPDAYRAASDICGLTLL